MQKSTLRKRNEKEVEKIRESDILGEIYVHDKKES